MKHSNDIDCILIDIDFILLNGATDTPAATPVHSATRVPSAVIVLLATPAVLAEGEAALTAQAAGARFATLKYFSWKTPGRKKHARRCHAENPGGDAPPNRYLLIIAAIALAAAFLPASRAAADGTGNLLYSPSAANEANLSRTDHGANGRTVLATTHMYAGGGA